MTRNAINDFTDPTLERFVRSQALSHHSEMQLDKAVNRLFEDAGRRKMKLEKMRMEKMLSELSATQATPRFNAHSQQLAASMNNKPIYKRVNEI